MSLPTTDINDTPYFEMDVIKENLEQAGVPINESKIQNWGDESDREIDQEFIYLFNTFPMTEQSLVNEGFKTNDFKKIKQLSNARTEAKYWFKTNSDRTLLDESDKQLEKFKKDLTQIPATTE